MKGRLRQHGRVSARLIALVCFLAAADSNAIAKDSSGMTLALWGAAEFSDLGQVESDVARIANEEKEDFLYYFGGSAASSSAGSGAGFGVGLEISRAMSPAMGFGARVGYCGPGDITGEASGHGDFNESLNETWKIATSLVPVLGGLWFEGGDPEGIHFRGALFVGAVFGSATLDQSGAIDLPLIGYKESYSSSAPASGSAFAADFSGRLSHSLTPKTAIFIELGYLIATIKQMRMDKDVDVDADGDFDYQRGDVFERSGSTDALEFDFGGLRIRGGLVFSFGKSETVTSN